MTQHEPQAMGLIEAQANVLAWAQVAAPVNESANASANIPAKAQASPAPYPLPSALRRTHPYCPPTDTGLKIIYQDHDLLAMDKPAGLLSVPGRGEQMQDCALHRVQMHMPQALLVHRLDEATSGLLLFALTPIAQKALSIAFAARQIRKSYVAWVHGMGLAEQGVLDAAIAVDWANRPLRKIDHEQGQSAVTNYRVRKPNEKLGQTLIELEPMTGRTHQLRVHLQYAGHPIVGDRLYGLPADRAERLMLHAQSLQFAHPRDAAQLITLTCPAPF